ncbi:PedC/BrcD family bacteriocin maturation disulfide isomerase [Lactiplantibacillus xiangfangensis]|uniref:Bacteriocin transport accessory protein n=1 Tax=Lactiplantibacillus xiangfangensis TaxID=942150 RepID=A0A0R2MAM5_9LACO|nr:PedC/BrcD family bacteriocin maturation disulfide isomerase [Lactiplantibacillus xiangfangensis]KRO10487.1 hypothetical protein IV64_GL002796 [Lactiplantibacillus xiangfangensis]
MTTITEDQYLSNIKGVKYLSASAYLDMLKNGQKFVLFIGFKECPYCRKFSTTLNAYLKNPTTQIYYLDLDQFDNDSMQNLFDQVITDSGLQYTPTVEKINQGVIVNKLVGSTITLSQLRSL